MATVEQQPQPNAARSNRSEAPGPAGGWMWGVLGELKRDPLSFLMACSQEYGDISRFRIGPPGWGRLAHLVVRPDDIKHVLVDNQRNYKKAVTYNSVRLFLGDGLVTSEGEFWKRQRRIVNPVFHQERLMSLGPTMCDVIGRFVDRWSEGDPAQQVDVAAAMRRLTLDILCRTMFSADLSSDADVVDAALDTVLRYAIRRVTINIGLLNRLPTAENHRFRDAVSSLDGVVERLIAQRRADAHREPDLLSMMLEARDDVTGAGMSDRQLRDEMLTFLLAGHETTANALAWSWYLLAQHSEVERRFHAELDEVLGGRAPTVADLSRLTYTRQVFEESMRIYPPVWAIERNAIGDDEIGGYRIPAGSVVILSPYVTQHCPRFWDAPETFDPDRFCKTASAGRPSLSYFPFGGGARVCIGKGFALLEGTLILAALGQRYRLRLAPAARVEPQPLLTLRPRFGLPMAVESR